jgi:two-component system OmpR family sensor kinase/two-component system sensor histidine kinase BaeS
MRSSREDCRPGRRWRGGYGSPPFGRGEFARRRRFFRWLAAIAVIVVAFGLWGLFTLAWLVAVRLGLVGAAPPSAPVFLVASWIAGLALVSFLRFGRRLSLPVRAVMDAADHVANGDYTVRVEPHGPPPVRALANAFNTMTERLARHDEQRRNLMADVAHELRTPLTVIQGRVEGLLDGVYPRDDAGLELVLEETRVLSRLIDDLRTLALSEAGALTLEKEVVDVAALARDLVEALSSDATNRGISIQVTGDAQATVAIDPVRIRQVLTNVISNALSHTPTGGTVTVAVAHSAAALSVSVIDTGAGMSADQAAHAFDRFYKGPGSRGSGLGLAIAHGLVVAHSGAIDVASEQGRGTTITITLPSGT